MSATMDCVQHRESGYCLQSVIHMKMHATTRLQVWCKCNAAADGGEPVVRQR